MVAGLLNWVYPAKCGLCGRFGEKAICDECLAEFQPLDAYPQETAGTVSEVFRLYKYDSRASQAIRRLKYSRITSLGPVLAELVRQAYEAHDLDHYTAVVPIPIHWRRRAMRGFNQADLLATALPKHIVRKDILIRSRFTRPQATLGRDQRRTNLIDAFLATPRAEGQSILLIDDVTTSGHTAEQCAWELRSKGATRVGLLAVTGEV